jgi:hypothetical protein
VAGARVGGRVGRRVGGRVGHALGRTVFWGFKTRSCPISTFYSLWSLTGSTDRRRNARFVVNGERTMKFTCAVDMGSSC